MPPLKDLEQKLGVKFQRLELLAIALVHRSYLNETTKKNLDSNERLEFLGDAILSFIVSEWLYQEFPHHPEGNLTNLRSSMVKSESLSEIAQDFQLGDYLLLSKGEKDSGGQKNPVLLANTLEAVIGAIFLDQGLSGTKKFIRLNFKSLLERLKKLVELKDGKSVLQENLQAQTKLPPVYKTLKEDGPDHAKIFTVGVFSQNQLLAVGQGKSKQLAQEAAAKLALEKLKPKN